MASWREREEYQVELPYSSLLWVSCPYFLLLDSVSLKISCFIQRKLFAAAIIVFTNNDCFFLK